MAGQIPWLAVGAVVSGAASLAFLRFAWRYRAEPGARFFVVTIACEALWAFSYGVALLVFDPALRWLFEIPIWLGINFIGVSFLAFALEYTGRSTLLRSRWMGGLVGLQVLHTLLVATNPLHNLAWGGYHIDPVFGAATVTYTHGPWLFLNVTGIILTVAAGSFILTDTFFSYGPLYRTQTAAVALSPLLPGLAFLLWLLQVGPVWQINFTALTFPVHLAFDGYAFFSRDMFDLTPAARRAGERAAIDDLGTAVLIVDDEDRIVNLNGEGERVLGVDQETALGRPLGEYLGDVDSTTGDSISITTDGTRREYTVTTSPLEDGGGSRVGATIVLQDVTEERQREQRLAVLNRILRHNLRNDLNVVQGYLSVIRDRIGQAELPDLHATAEEKTVDLVELAEKARDIERTMGREGNSSEQIRVAALLAEIRAELLAEYDGDIRIEVPEQVVLIADRMLVDHVFRNLVENGLEHGDDTPVVTVTFGEVDDRTERGQFEVRDDGTGIPDHELTVIETGEETALEHGSGLGLWLADGAVTTLGGELRFEIDEEGTTVLIDLPGVVEDYA